MSTQTFYSNGKLLLTGEYLVIDGAEALAIPTKKGQSLVIEEIETGNSELIWKSFTNDDKPWLNVTFDKKTLEIIDFNDEKSAFWLQNVLKTVKKLSKDFLDDSYSIKVTTKLDFPQNWGLGSSSTLLNNIAQWAKIDAFRLHFSVSNGSGYDIACASSNSPLIYSISNKITTVKEVNFSPVFRENIFFIHLNQKQNSFNEVEGYNSLKKDIDLPLLVKKITAITEKMANCNTLSHFEELINQHEYILSNILQRETVKEQLFPLYNGAIKSLGAWGGDFIMATGMKENSQYFIERGYETILGFEEIVLGGNKISDRKRDTQTE